MVPVSDNGEARVPDRVLVCLRRGRPTQPRDELGEQSTVAHDSDSFRVMAGCDPFQAPRHPISRHAQRFPAGRDPPQVVPRSSLKIHVGFLREVRGVRRPFPQTFLSLQGDMKRGLQDCRGLDGPEDRARVDRGGFGEGPLGAEAVHLLPAFGGQRREIEVRRVARPHNRAVAD